MPTQSIRPCQTFQSNASDPAVISSFDMPGLSYVDEPIEQVRKMVPGLDPVKVEASPDPDRAGAATPSQDETKFILSKTSAAVAYMVHRMPNLIATEDVRDLIKIDGSNYYNTRSYNYAIVHRQTPLSDDPFAEFRTDARGQPISYSPDDPARPVDVGFATTWQFFIPSKLHESRFRYLGQQSVGHVKTYVLAFAQIPGKAGLRAVIYYPSGRCSTALQGVAWIDQSTFQIVRMQTDLLSPLPAIQLYQLRSILTYRPVKIHGLKLSLWLPRDVENTWEPALQFVEEFHRYSHYRLFKSNVRILPGFKPLRK
ncbi:MAG TPA: hypothetical protein VF730_15710 [Terracidiphilus sp.]